MASGQEEDDALLTGEPTSKRSDGPVLVKSRMRELGLFVWAVLATAIVLVLAVVYQHGQSEGSAGNLKPLDKRNLIFMVSDGMGPTSMSLARSFRQFTDQLPQDDILVLEKHLIGQSRTKSSNSLITDSAAGATAFSCGIKTYNGAISVLPNHEPCGSIMEAAKRQGYTTGLVVTTRITDATPAVFVSHARSRALEDGIASQMLGLTHPLGRMVDLMFGGGRCHFLGNETEDTCREDGVDMLKKAQEELGWNYISSRSEFDDLGSNIKLPLLGLFANDNIPYEIDRRHQTDVYPSLEEMTKTALHALSAASKNNKQGFFVMIEGSRIDHAGHGNDPAAQVHEILAYDKAVAAVLDFIEHDSNDTPTLMISTSDHETGGLAAGRQLHAEYPAYRWFPDALANATHSASWTAHEYELHQNTTSEVDHNKDYLVTLLSDSLGITNASKAELEKFSAKNARPSYLFADMISRRAQTGWSTHGHSAADVNIYASDRRLAADLAGNHENTGVGGFLCKYLGVERELQTVTEQLKEFRETIDDTWLGEITGEWWIPQVNVEHYSGDY
nr:repressible alkaline phosphatase [Quercus suber]